MYKKQRRPSDKQYQLYHPGYEPDYVRPAGLVNCGCRPGHWCAFHRNQAARDAGRAAQEREAARRR